MTAPQSLCPQHHYRSVCSPSSHKCVTSSDIIMFTFLIYPLHYVPRKLALLPLFLLNELLSMPYRRTRLEERLGFSHWRIYGLPHDGSWSSAGESTWPSHSFIEISSITRTGWFAHALSGYVYLQWVKDVADAGGKSYTFHIEATGEGTSRTLYSINSSWKNKKQLTQSLLSTRHARPSTSSTLSFNNTQKERTALST